MNVTGGSELSKFSTGVGYQYQDGIFGGETKGKTLEDMTRLWKERAR